MSPSEVDKRVSKLWEYVRNNHMKLDRGWYCKHIKQMILDAIESETARADEFKKANSVLRKEKSELNKQIKELTPPDKDIEYAEAVES